MADAPPMRTPQGTDAPEWIPGSDPSAAVEVLIAEAEALRLQGDLGPGGNPIRSYPLRDLSPLGR
jgi:hypothetical protein